jgi:hypothetical protein
MPDLHMRLHPCQKYIPSFRLLMISGKIGIPPSLLWKSFVAWLPLLYNRVTWDNSRKSWHWEGNRPPRGVVRSVYIQLWTVAVISWNLQVRKERRCGLPPMGSLGDPVRNCRKTRRSLREKELRISKRLRMLLLSMLKPWSALTQSKRAIVRYIKKGEYYRMTNLHLIFQRP